MPRLYKRNKTWYCDVNINGERVRKPLDTDRRFAEEKLLRLVEQRNARKFHRPIQGITWAEFKVKFLEYATNRKSPDTLRHDKAAIRGMEEHAAIFKLSQINPELLEELQGKWKREGHIPSLVNRRICSLKAMMRKAEEWEYVKIQNWNIVKKFKEPKGRLLWYPVEDLKKILSGCHGMWKTVGLLGARAGMRRGEIRALSWQNVDFERNRIHIVANDDWTPKDFERRFIPIATDLRIHLESLPKASKWVLGDPRPSLMVLSVYFRKIVRKANLPGSLHTLRHTFASHLVSNGVPLKEVKELLGHASIEKTEIYAHLAPDRIDEAILKLPNL